MRILVVKLADIGDLLTATPALAALRETFPAARIDLLTTPHSAPVVHGTGLVDTVITFDKFAFDHPCDALRPANLAAALGLAVRLRARRYGTVVILHHLTTRFGAVKYAALAFAAAPRRVGLDNGRGWFLTDAARDDGFGARHEVEYGLDVVALLGAHTLDPALRPPVGAACPPLRNRRRPARRHPSGERGYSLARRWDPASFAAVADALHEGHGARIVLVGTAADDVEAVRAQMQHAPLDLSGRTTLRALAALLRRADLFIGADSGVMHLAAAAGTPTVAIFGPSNHRAWGPWSPHAPARVVRSAPLCSPCSYVGGGGGLREGCAARTCMRMVTPAHVIAAARELLSGARTVTPPAAPQLPGPDLPERARRRTVSILGVPVDDITFDALLDRIGAWVRAGGPARQIATANPEFVMIARRDPNFYNILQRAHVVAPDGVGLLWAARRYGTPLRERVTGSDGVPLIAARAAREGWRLFFLGAREGVAAEAAQVLAARHPGLQVVGTYAGSPAGEAEDDIVARINRTGADILFVAYGAPTQDKWIARNLPRLEVSVAMGVGGAFDFITGMAQRAPRWMQRLGLEWLHRLVREPWRWRRQMRLPRFVVAVLIDCARRNC
ncbi:MAG: WecB/TagA/CpsF family glycosyltransferase [Anaerolineae bacterium]|nr:WecB/TagA/CpsF family glycosyltransferase [Anaerolineae bacterium]